MNNTYNKKAFLLPNSINSMAGYHGKVYETGEYRFRIHDCITGVCLRGNLNTPEDVTEAYNKAEALIEGLQGFKDFVFENFIKKENT
ncbi:MAG: hypothetical protein EZS26_000779 [Candidatus Ordinivivax streblomastigis]|uniref:Uncharacterized protein n=1 Tax=Candidatus Ordinivivax streblomastigis TaxID=2540710 RepID=A0A5M8P4B8_9BACT|nr:MAG: hypothetical protein EZS26_000779 [Candidatus Ordinivivax streblomastigis]